MDLIIPLVFFNCDKRKLEKKNRSQNIVKPLLKNSATRIIRKIKLVRTSNNIRLIIRVFEFIRISFEYSRLQYFNMPKIT